jgi:hypothetical protein
MPLHLITGHKGEAHISSADVGAFNAGVFGQGEYVLNTGQKFKIEVLSNNAVKIYDGDLIMQGRHISLKSGSSEELAIDNGTADLNRIDLIVIRYTQDIETGIENAEFAVIKGIPAVEAVAPEYTTGNILSGGCVLHEMPLYKIPISGLAIGEPVKLFTECGNVGDSMAFRGWNPLISITEDTPKKWRELGTGIWMIDLPDRIIGQPSQWGFLYNTVCAEEVAQKFIVQASGETFRRNANGIGWYGNDWRNGKWVSVHDDETAPFMADGYHGTGTAGSGGACRLSFPFKPKFVLVLDGEDYMFIHHYKPDAYKIYGSGDTGQPRKNIVTFGDNYVEWYSDKDDAEYQLNESGVYYHYSAWG